MLHRIRLEATVAAALAIAVAALVLALRDGNGSTPSVSNDTGDAAQAAAAIPEGAFEAKIAGMSYSPEPIRVKPGTVVAWTNIDGVAHTVTADDRSWDSEIMDIGDKYTHAFDEPGTYVYICTLHPPLQGAIFQQTGSAQLAGGGGHGMKGTVIVE